MMATDFNIGHQSNFFIYNQSPVSPSLAAFTLDTLEELHGRKDGANETQEKASKPQKYSGFNYLSHQES